VSRRDSISPLDCQCNLWIALGLLDSRSTSCGNDETFCLTPRGPSPVVIPGTDPGSRGSALFITRFRSLGLPYLWDAKLRNLHVLNSVASVLSPLLFWLSPEAKNISTELTEQTGATMKVRIPRSHETGLSDCEPGS